MAMATPPSHLHTFLPDTSRLKLKSFEHPDSGQALIFATTNGLTANCPSCQHPSRSLHSRYRRVLRDLPLQGSSVELRLDVRRFRCRTRECPRVTFAETLPLVARRYGRQTSRLSETVRLIGYVLGGEAGARLLARLSMASSPDTVLRRLKLGPSLPVSAAKAIGVDDWAWRKGHRYGTILVDLESHVPIDLLPERSADSLAAWLEAHPGAEIISRDRAELYAEGARRGAPQAVQVADRFHLLCNLTSAVERVLEQKRTALATAIVPAAPDGLPIQTDNPPRDKTRAEKVREGRRQHRLERYNEVVGLHNQGMSQQEISRTVHMERKTIRKLLRAGQFPERAPSPQRLLSVSKFQPFLQRRWNEGCHNATALWQEIKDQGYSGGRSTMTRYVATLRTPETKYFRQTASPRQPKAKAPSPRQAAMLLARRSEKLNPDEQQLLKKLNKCCLEIPILYKLTQGFAAVFRNKKLDDLHSWIDDARRTDLPELGRFCDGLIHDIEAVTAAVILPWSNGQVEGQIHRLKLVKRQMYGRANFNLLRRRVLPYVPATVALSPKHTP